MTALVQVEYSPGGTKYVVIESAITHYYDYNRGDERDGRANVWCGTGAYATPRSMVLAARSVYP